MGLVTSIWKKLTKVPTILCGTTRAASTAKWWCRLRCLCHRESRVRWSSRTLRFRKTDHVSSSTRTQNAYGTARHAVTIGCWIARVASCGSSVVRMPNLSTLMFATFSPDGRHVAYVRQRSSSPARICETIRSDRWRSRRRRRRSTARLIGCMRRSFHCARDFVGALTAKRSPTGNSTPVACHQFPLVNDTDSLYPRITWIRYPKAGTQNSACRVGVVRLDTGKTTWMQVPGDAQARSLHCPHGLGGRFQSSYCPAIQPSAEQLSRYVGGGQHRERSNGFNRNGPGLGRRG